MTGIWHGAEWNFVFWGLYFALLLVLEKLCFNKILARLPAVINHIYVMFLVILSFAIFNGQGIGEVKEILMGLFGGLEIPLYNQVTIYYLKSYGIVFIIAIIASTPLATYIIKKLNTYSLGKKIINLLQPIVISVLLLLVTGYLVDGSFNPFLYFRF